MDNNNSSGTNKDEYWVQEALLQPPEDGIKNEKKEKNKSSSLFLLLVAISVDLNLFTTGCGMVWTSPVLAKLKSNDTAVNPLGFPITTSQESLIAGWFSVGFLVGPAITPTAAHLMGSKHLITATGILQMVSFVVLAFSENIYMYYILRFVLGTCGGVASAILSVYVSEITDKYNRGRYSAMIGVFPPLGHLYGFVVGPFFSVKMFSLLCAAPSLIYVPFSIFIAPDSPFHLVSKGNDLKAEKNLRKLRNREDVSKDLKEIEVLVKTEGHGEKFSFKLFNNRAARRGLVISFGCSILQALSGILVIMAFLGPIFDSAEIKISGNYVAILVGITKITTFTFASAIVEKSGRRPLMLISTVFTSIPLFLLGLFFYLKSHNFAYVNEIWWLPVASVLMFIMSYSLGIGSIIWVYLSEVFPTNIKPVAISLAGIVFSIASALATFAFPFMVEYFGIPACFWSYSSVCAIGVVFVYFVAPETKGKSLLEIQEMLAHSKH